MAVGLASGETSTSESMAAEHQTLAQQPAPKPEPGRGSEARAADEVTLEPEPGPGSEAPAADEAAPEPTAFAWAAKEPTPDAQPPVVEASVHEPGNGAQTSPALPADEPAEPAMSEAGTEDPAATELLAAMKEVERLTKLLEDRNAKLLGRSEPESTAIDLDAVEDHERDRHDESDARRA